MPLVQRVNLFTLKSFTCIIFRLRLSGVYFTVDILTLHCRKTTGVTSDINNGYSSTGPPYTIPRLCPRKPLDLLSITQYVTSAILFVQIRRIKFLPDKEPSTITTVEQKLVSVYFQRSVPWYTAPHLVDENPELQAALHLWTMTPSMIHEMSRISAYCSQWWFSEWDLKPKELNRIHPAFILPLTDTLCLLLHVKVILQTKCPFCCSVIGVYRPLAVCWNSTKLQKFLLQLFPWHSLTLVSCVPIRLVAVTRLACRLLKNTFVLAGGKQQLFFFNFPSTLNQ